MPIVDKARCACDCHERAMEVCRECCVRTAKDHAFQTMMKQNQTVLDLQAELEKLQRTGAALPALFKIQEACPAAGIASGIAVGVEIIVREYKQTLLENQELKNEVARLTRNEKCYGCGHSHENHDPNGCLVWVEADAHRKCLCKKWIATEKRIEGA